MELKLEKVNAHEFIKEISDKFESTKERVSLSYNDNLKKNVFVKLDKFHFNNAILNLLENADKYSKSETMINIELNSKKNNLQIKISDNGIGISKNDQQKIFETFYRVQTGNIHDIKGYGIGLSYVKKIIESHNGQISVESKLNVGTTFIIELPYD